MRVGWMLQRKLRRFLHLQAMPLKIREILFLSLPGSLPVLMVWVWGHPMLPKSRCIYNDVAFKDKTFVFVVSGSNMSGKSTLLRTVGANAVLAMMGAPVRAKSLKMSLLTIGASIRTMDSLKEGTSRFYAEIKCLEQLVNTCRRLHSVDVSA